MSLGLSDLVPSPFHYLIFLAVALTIIAFIYSRIAANIQDDYDGMCFENEVQGE